MVIRSAIQCISCESKFITRTQVRHKERQEHSFPCPRCGITLSFVLDLDQQKAGFKFREPKNAKWIDSEEGALETLTFSDEILVPIEIGAMFSPHLSTIGNYEDFEKYRKDEGLRQLFLGKILPYAERCRVHFEKGNWTLFDKESPSLNNEARTVRGRLIDLSNALHVGFSKFTVNTPGQYNRVLQRLAYAQSTSPELFSKLASNFTSNGNTLRLRKEIAIARATFAEGYPAIQPLYQINHWKQRFRNLDAVRLSDKRFGLLCQIYIDCFETMCRLMVPAMGIEMIIDHRSLEIPTKKGSMTLDDFERLVNASKREHIRKWPIEDLFVPLIDTDLRNGVGHNSVHFDKESDQIVLYDSKGAGKASRILGYTDFCDRVVRVFSGLELALMYHNGLHIGMEGRFT
jgi:hypothetical protein